MRPRRAAAFAALAAAAALLAVDIVTPTLDIDAGENVVCTFTNTKLQ